ncbi:hypothetical protein COO55_20710 [Rhodococcus opacus]|nr:hypothetical protein COO55_20710 [Rhodococcus opacus]
MPLTPTRPKPSRRVSTDAVAGCLPSNTAGEAPDYRPASQATSRSRTWRIRRPRRSPTTLANETADVMTVTFERYASVSFAMSLPSIAHRLQPR